MSTREFDDEYDKILLKIDAAARDYASFMLWDRLPIECQGDTSAKSRGLRRLKADEAAERWVKLQNHGRQMIRECDAKKAAAQ